MNINTTAFILIGYQNDYFAENGVLRPIIEENTKTSNIIANTIKLLQQLPEGPTPIVISTPIVFTPDYQELEEDTVGILQYIRQVGAFKAGHHGSETIPELIKFGDRIHYLPGKHGLNAFSNTFLQEFLIGAWIENVVLCGAVTSICIDSTGRAAHERGYKVFVLSDCTSARTTLEQEFYMRHIFPLYAEVLNSNQLIEKLGI